MKIGDDVYYIATTKNHHWFPVTIEGSQKYGDKTLFVIRTKNGLKWFTYGHNLRDKNNLQWNENE